MSRSTRLTRSAALAATLTIVLGACGERSGKVLDEPVFPPPETTLAPPVTAAPSGGSPETPAVLPLTLVTPWVDGAMIPDRNTCADAGVSPAITWSNVPPGTVELAVSVVDVDAGPFVHWIVYGVSPAAPGLDEGRLPDGAFEWPNSSGRADWFAPCPPAGETHRYEFTVYALNQQLEAADDAPATEVLSILDATTIGRSSVSGLATGAG
jgi:Raf kinase inhibitor-like YbhB/YbcL family protein